MIGKRVTIIRSIHKNDREGFKNKEYTGVILDKIRAHNKVENKIYACDYYLVELPEGIVGKFFCDEVVKVLPEEKKQLA